MNMETKLLLHYGYCSYERNKADYFTLRVELCVPVGMSQKQADVYYMHEDATVLLLASRT